jgi:hypothetical protein
MITANRAAILVGVARRRVSVDRSRHRDRKTKARPGFTPGGPAIPTITARAQISICRPAAA